MIDFRQNLNASDQMRDIEQPFDRTMTPEQNNFIVNNTIVSWGGHLKKNKTILGKKKKKASKKKVGTARGMSRTAKSANTVRPLSDEEEIGTDTQQDVQIVDQTQDDPESEEILMMIQNLWEKKALGVMSKLDKKLMKKLQQIVADNPKNYSGKIGYLQMVYQ